MSKTEKFKLTRSIIGWRLVPCDPQNHPLLTEICGGDFWSVTIKKADHPTVKQAIAFIKDVCLDCGISAQVCGDMLRSPTIILRKKVQAAIKELRVDLHHCVFAESTETWCDCGYSDAVSQLNTLLVGETILLRSTPKNASRSGYAYIERRGASSWLVNGCISSPWDDGHDLAESLNILLQERSDSDIPELDSDIRPYLADYNKKHQTEYVNAMPYGRFMEVTPVHESCDGPGTAWDFQWRIRGDVAHLLRRLSDEESKAMQHDEREWASLPDLLLLD